MMADSTDRSMAPRMAHSRVVLKDCLKARYLAKLMGAEMARRTAAEMGRPMACHSAWWRASQMASLKAKQRAALMVTLMGSSKACQMEHEMEEQTGWLSARHWAYSMAWQMEHSTGS